MPTMLAQRIEPSRVAIGKLQRDRLELSLLVCLFGFEAGTEA